MVFVFVAKCICDHHTLFTNSHIHWYMCYHETHICHWYWHSFLSIEIFPLVKLTLSGQSQKKTAFQSLKPKSQKQSWIQSRKSIFSYVWMFVFSLLQSVVGRTCDGTGQTTWEGLTFWCMWWTPLTGAASHWLRLNCTACWGWSPSCPWSSWETSR